MRKSHDKAFKAKVTLEALREESTLQELGKKYDIHPTQISQWKKQVIDGLSDLFERPNKKGDSERQAEEDRDTLLKTVGEMKLENDFLKKKYRQLYGKEPF
jgi:transposase